jgi:hypothetical protein
MVCCCMRLVLLLILTLLGIALVFYLSWLPQPKLGLNWFIPNWLATWADTNSNGALRTGVPFVILGILIGTGLKIKGYPWYTWAAFWLVLTLVVLIAEFGQFYLPYRSFDVWDVVWGATGAVVGLALPIVCVTIKDILQKMLKKGSSSHWGCF